MIRVNLNPAGKPGRKRRPGFSLGTIGGFPKDRWIQTALAIGIVATVGIVYLFLSVRSRVEEAEVGLQTALQDSARWADLIARSNALVARRDSILERVAVIQEIDSERYVWPHVLDEISAALPDYTWLDQLQQLAFGGGDVRIAVRGKAGNNFALAQFMTNLEASPFLRNVRLVTTDLGNDQASGYLVYSFDLEVSYELPADEFVERVPLFQSTPEEVDEQPQPVPEGLGDPGL